VDLDKHKAHFKLINERARRFLGSNTEGRTE